MSLSKEIKQLIDRKRRYDPDGLAKAERDGKLREYLSKDLKILGIDPNNLFYDNKSNNISNNNYNNNNNTTNNDIDKLINTVSNILDENVYDPLYLSIRDSFDRSLASNISDYNRFDILNDQLKTIKVLSASGGLLCLSLSLATAITRRPFFTLLYGIASYDLLLISYNCYIKRYISLAIYKLGGSIVNIGETMLQWLGNAIGIRENNPLDSINDEISYDLLYKDTLTIRIINKIKKILK